MCLVQINVWTLVMEIWDFSSDVEVNVERNVVKNADAVSGCQDRLKTGTKQMFFFEEEYQHNNQLFEGQLFVP